MSVLQSIVIGGTQFPVESILVHGLAVCPFYRFCTRNCQPSTMVDPKRSGSSKKLQVKSHSAAAKANLLHLGWKPPPTVIGQKTISPEVIALRNNANDKHAYKHCNVREWNNYVTFGFQDFVSPISFQQHLATESVDDGYIRTARNFGNHLENDAPVTHLMWTIQSVELSLAKTHPGFYDIR